MSEQLPPSLDQLDAILAEMDALKFIDCERVLVLSQRAQRLAETLNAPTHLARAFNGAAGAYNINGELDRSTEYAMRAINLAQMHSLPQIEGWALTLLSANFQLTRDFRTARQLLDRQRELADLVHDDALNAATLNDLGNMYFSLNDYQRGIEALHEALTYAHSDYFGGAILGIVHANLTLVYGETKQYRQMREHGEQAIYWNRASQSRDLLATAYIYMANGHLAFEEYEQAQICLDAAHSTVVQDDVPWRLISYLDTQGKLLAAQGKFPAAMNSLVDALSLAREHQLFSSEVQVHASMIQAYQLQGNHEAVCHHQHLMHEISEKANYHNFEQRLDILRTIFSTSISSHREALQRLKLTTDQPARADAVPDDFRQAILTRLSHEFRTPLTIIGIGADLLSRYYERMTETQRITQFKRIQERVNWMTLKLDDILLLLKLKHGERLATIHSIVLQEVMDDVQHEIAQFYGDSRRVVWDATPDSAIMLDGELLREILVQLISNALKFSRDVVTVRLQMQADQLAINVEDTGIGVPPDEIASVKEVFYRGSNLDETPGYGIGLAIVDQAVASCDGEWQITSQLNVGTQVTVTLPARGSAN